MLSFLQFTLFEAKIPGVVTHVSSGDNGIHHVTAYHKDADLPFHNSFLNPKITHPQGMTARNMIGYVRFKRNSRKHETSSELTSVHKDWRRKGIASDMYDASAKAHRGSFPVPSKERSDQGKAFWGGYTHA